MTISVKKHSILISIVFLLSILLLAFFLPSIALIIGIVILFFSFIMASFSIVKKNQDMYLQNKISRGMFLRITSLEIFGILLGMTLAGLLGRYLTQIATAQITNEPARILVGILIGLLTGAGVGWLVGQRRIPSSQEYASGSKR